MKDIVQFCDMTSDTIENYIVTRHYAVFIIKQQESNIKGIQNEVKQQSICSKILLQRKFKKISNLQYKPKTTTQPMIQKKVKDLSII